MEDILPKQIVWNVKQGFSTPDSNWYIGRSMELLDKSIQTVKDIMNVDIIKNLVEEHKRGKRNHRLFLWSLIYFAEFLNVWFA